MECIVGPFCVCTWWSEAARSHSRKVVDEVRFWFGGIFTDFKLSEADKKKKKAALFDKSNIVCNESLARCVQIHLFLSQYCVICILLS